MTVDIADNDSAGAGVAITPSDGSTEVSENGDTDTYQVVLSSAPGANVTISLASPDGQLTAVDQANPEHDFLVFTPSDWSTPQTVEVAAVEDDLMEGNHDRIIIHQATSTDSQYDGIEIGSVTATIDDNDLGLILLALDVAPGIDGIFGVDLLTSGIEFDFDLVTFDFAIKGAPYFDQVYFDFRGDPSNNECKIYFDLNEAYDNVISDDPSVRITQTDYSTDAVEAGATDTYTVVLTKQPTAQVDVAVTPDSQVNVSPTTLHFSTDDWYTPQQVTVSAVNDSDVEGAHTGVISHTVSSDDPDYDGISVANVTVHITDDDVALLEIVHSGGSTDVVEGGDGDSFTVRLSQPPSTTETSVQWSLNSPPDSPQVHAENPDPLFGLPDFKNMCVFRDDWGLPWDEPQTIEVDAIDDSILEGPHTVDLVLKIFDDYEEIGQQVVKIHISDNDAGGVVITETGGSTDVTEGGAADTYTVVLTKQPTADVTIALGHDEEQLTVVDDANPSNAFLVFDDEHPWNTPQTVRVTALDDPWAEGLQVRQITHTATSSDPAYNGFSFADVTVDITDNDSPGLAITETGGSTDVTEGGEPDYYDVVLTSEPTADVWVFFENIDWEVIAVDDAHPQNGFLYFSTSNWNIPQTVRVTAVDDDSVENPQTSVSLLTNDAFSSDPSYQGETVLAVNVTDNDTGGVIGRYIFYNNSSWDGNTPGADPLDDGAIATDKEALLPGHTATFANYTSYSRGINGIMIDIAGLSGTPDENDFTFKVGNDDDPSGWSNAPTTTSVTVRAGAGEGGSDRITIIWADNAVQNQWLEVTAKAANLGLAADDVFYFGNAIGETGNSSENAYVLSPDLIAIRDAIPGLGVSVENTLDIDRDGKVLSPDLIACRDNIPALVELISPPELLGGGEGAPAGAGVGLLTDLEPSDFDYSVPTSVEADTYLPEIEETVPEEDIAPPDPEFELFDPYYSVPPRVEVEAYLAEIEEAVPEEDVAPPEPGLGLIDPYYSVPPPVEVEAYLPEIEETVPEEYVAPPEPEFDLFDPYYSVPPPVELDEYLAEFQPTVPEEYLAVPGPGCVDLCYRVLPTPEAKASRAEIEETVPEEYIAPTDPEFDFLDPSYSVPITLEADAYLAEIEQTDGYEYPSLVSEEDYQCESTSAELLFAEAFWLYARDAFSPDKEADEPLEPYAADDVFASWYAE